MRSIVLIGVLCVVGCDTIPGERFRETQHKYQLAGEEIKRLESELAAQQQANRVMQSQVLEQRGLKIPAEDLVIPEKIVLDRLSGGYDDDGKTGDDGIVLYIQPIDRDGDVFKAAGQLEVTLFDLQAAPENRIAVYNFDANKTRSLWYGKLLTHHFTVHCPWPEHKPPAHDQVTARVTFTELLTGQSFKATGTYTIKFPPQRTTTAPK